LETANGSEPVLYNAPSLCYLIAMKVEYDGAIKDVSKRMSVGRLLETFSLSREAHLVVVNGRLVTEDFTPANEDQVRIIKVISGG
jgi:sulfur carrier protein ThiS